MSARTLAALLGLGALALFAGACGDDEEDPTTSATAAAASSTMAEATSMADSTMAAESSMTESTMAADSSMADSTMGGDSSMAAGTDAAAGTIVEVAAGNPDFSILVEAVQAAGLAETLSGAGPFTVLAPTNEAFEAALGALGMTKEELLASDDLAAILTYHVLAGEVGSADIAAEPSRETVQGEPVEIAADGGAVTINGTAKVVTADVPASNGVIHAIDAVLLPPTIAAALSGAAEAGSTTG